MLCERCHAREAVIHLMLVLEGTSTTHHFCSGCARAHGAATVAVPVEPLPGPDNSGGPRRERR
jgi:protein-arginine kinase activator protein McsA